MRFNPVLVLALLVPAPAFAQQLVTFNQVVTITERGNGAGAFHYLIKPAATEPGSWTTPIDYSRGAAHVHLEVMEKPSKRNTTITICFDGNLEGYGCITSGAYTDVGTYDTVRALPTATWQYDKIAWARRRQEYHLVVKDPALGGTPGGRPASDYAPTKMRIVMTIVPPGGTYAPPPGVATPAADAGADTAAASSPDAAAPPPPAEPAAPDAAAPGGAAPPNPPSTPPPAPASPGPSPTPAPSNAPVATPASTPAVSGGCSVASAGAGAAGLFLSALLLGLLRPRRRRPRTAAGA